MPAQSTEDIIASLVEFVNRRKVTITREEMLKIAQLVRIKLSENEIEYYSKELTMLDWIHDTLSQINTEGILPVHYGNIDKKFHTRSDDACIQNIKDEILQNTKPEDGYFVVSQVISETTTKK